MRLELSLHTEGQYTDAPVAVTCVVGTRPEVIKMAPVVRALRADASRFDVRVVFTGQHRELLHQAAARFDLTPDVDLTVMRSDQSLSGLTARLLEGLDAELVDNPPDVVVAQGDTTTVASTALACYHRKIRFAHVEAGLRTESKYSPYPEEGNRRMISVLTDLHFAPTERARKALLRENVPPARIILTGNTVVDALMETLKRPLEMPVPVAVGRLCALLTMHRRENFDGGLDRVFEAAKILARKHDDLDIIYPVHPNPTVRRAAYDALCDAPNIRLVAPLDYHGFVATMARAAVVLTDSGGVQEEAPSLGVPVLVLRESTERPEGVEAGCAKLVGTDVGRIVSEVDAILTLRRARAPRAVVSNPYGDGRASLRIAEALWRLCRETDEQMPETEVA